MGATGKPAARKAAGPPTGGASVPTASAPEENPTTTRETMTP
jgi:hypothetical protein